MHLKQAICLYFFRQAAIFCKIRMLDGGAGDAPDLTNPPPEYQDVGPFPGLIPCGAFSVLHVGMTLTLMCWRGVGVQCWLAFSCTKIAVMTGMNLSSGLTACSSANDGFG